MCIYIHIYIYTYIYIYIHIICVYIYIYIYTIYIYIVFPIYCNSQSKGFLLDIPLKRSTITSRFFLIIAAWGHVQNLSFRSIASWGHVRNLGSRARPSCSTVVIWWFAHINFHILGEFQKFHHQEDMVITSQKHVGLGVAIISYQVSSMNHALYKFSITHHLLLCQSLPGLVEWWPGAPDCCRSGSNQLPVWVVCVCVFLCFYSCADV